MSAMSSNLSRAAGVSAALAGLLFIGIQFIHPSDDVASVTTPLWAATGYLTFGMALLGLVGVAGIFLRQVDKAGISGLLGFLLLGLFFLLTTAFTFAETLILPAVVGEAPQFVGNFLGIFNGTGTDGTLGALEMIGPLAGVLFTAGGILLGVSIFRARVLVPGAAILLAAGAVVPVLTAFLPHTAARFAAIPFGVALAWLGYSLWSRSATTDLVAPNAAR